MANLTDADERMLAVLVGDSMGFPCLSADLDFEESRLRGQLSRLIKNGLVTETSDNTFGLTRSGQRVLASTQGYSLGDRTHLTSEVNQRIDGFDLRPDRTDAVRSSYRFLKYWVNATAGEISEAIFRERPAGYESPTNWWENCIRDRLAMLRTVVPPESNLVWRHAAAEDDGHSKDGRHVSGNYGSIRHAIEHLPCSDRETRAVRRAFSHLFFRGPCTDKELAEIVSPEYPAGFDSGDEWWVQRLRDAFEELPGVERVEHGYEWQDGVGRKSSYCRSSGDSFYLAGNQ